MFRSLVQNVYLRQYIDCNFVDNKGNPNPWAEQVYHSLSFSFFGGGRVGVYEGCAGSSRLPTKLAWLLCDWCMINDMLS
jgi:hypothetical protein